MRRKRKVPPVRHRRILQHREDLRLQQARIEEQEQRRRRIQHVHRRNISVRKILLRKQHRMPFRIRHQHVRRNRLTIRQRAQPRIVFAAQRQSDPPSARDQTPRRASPATHIPPPLHPASSPPACYFSPSTAADSDASTGSHTPACTPPSDAAPPVPRPHAPAEASPPFAVQTWSPSSLHPSHPPAQAFHRTQSSPTADPKSSSPPSHRLAPQCGSSPSRCADHRPTDSTPPGRASPPTSHVCSPSDAARTPPLVPDN